MKADLHNAVVGYANQFDVAAVGLDGGPDQFDDARDTISNRSGGWGSCVHAISEQYSGQSHMKAAVGRRDLQSIAATAATAKKRGKVKDRTIAMARVHNNDAQGHQTTLGIDF